MTKNVEKNFNPKEVLDTNHNGKLDELETLETQIGLSQLEIQAINEGAPRLFPQYNKEWQNIKDPEEKKGYIFLLQFGQKELGKESFENLTQQIPLKEVSLFLYELLKTEKQKDLLTSASIILTNEEIKHLKENILTKKYTQKQLSKLQEFINEQLNQNISSAELIQGTTLSKKLEKNGKNPEKFMENIDTVFYAFFTDKIPNISQDTTRNMATGLTIALLKLYNKSKGKLPIFTSPTQILDNLSNITLIKNGIDTGINFLDKINLINKVVNETLNKKTSDKNELLMNPEKFSEFILKVIQKDMDEKEIKKEILDSQEKKNVKLNHKEIKSQLKSIFDTAGQSITGEQIEKISIIAGLGEEIKNAKEGIKSFKKQAQKALFANADTIIGMKETLKSIGIWKYFKKLINKLLELIGFKNGWDDFEKAVEEKKFKNVMNYLKENLTLKNIKKDKDSIFHKGFEKHLTGNNKISQIGIKGKLSYPVLSYLNSFGDNKTDLTEKLNNYFKNKNFKKLVEKAHLKDFEKKAFSIEKQTTDNKKINVGIINMDIISKAIEANMPKDFSENNQNEPEIQKEIIVQNGKLKFKEGYAEYKKQFLNNIFPKANSIAKQLGIPTSAILAQAALESNWGRSTLATEGHNLFGIKATNWDGETISLQTKEEENGQTKTINAKFRKYANYDECLEDYKKILSLPRYQKLLANTKNPEEIFQAIKKGGWATDSNYTGKLIAMNNDITKSCNLA